MKKEKLGNFFHFLYKKELKQNPHKQITELHKNPIKYGYSLMTKSSNQKIWFKIQENEIGKHKITREHEN